MASSGKKKQKGKGKTLSLNAFLADDKGASGPGASYVLANKPVNWGDEVDKEEAENDEPYETYGCSIKSKVNRAMLPTAPRAALGPDIDLERVPTKPPFKAFLGNLPYDVSEEEIEKFFRNLTVVDIRLPEDQGRMKGFGYAEFQDRQSLIDALSLNDGLLRNRKLRIDLAGSTQDKDDRRHGGDDGEDRTVGDWRRKEDRPSGFDDRSRDRPSGFDRDRYDDRRGDDRDRGGDRYDNRDRYGGRDRYDDNRDRYGGRDRYDDRRRYDDRDGGFGGDGRRQFGSGFRSDGDRYGDNRGSDRYGDNRGSDRYGPPRDRYGDRDRFEREREPPRDSSGEAKTRPRLALQPRTKPIEETAQAPAKTSSIFGGAKPVDTAAREREIEEKLYRQRSEDYDKIEKEKENRQRLNSSTSEKSRSRKDSSGSDGGSSSRRERKSSSSSGKGIRTVAPPPGAGSARVRTDSSRSDQEDVFVEDRDRHPISPSAKSNQSETPPKMIPAPPPKENIWEKRMEAQDGLSKGEEHLKKQEINQRQQDEDQKRKPVQPQDQKIESSKEEPGTEENHKSPPSQKKESQAEPPVGNVWEKRKQEREERERDDKHSDSSENERELE